MHIYLWVEWARCRLEALGMDSLAEAAWNFVGSPSRFGGSGKGMCGRTAGFHSEPQVDRTGR